MEQLRVMTIAFGFLFALLGISLMPKTAAAQDVTPTWAKWSFDLKADNSNFEALWHVTVGGEDKAGDPVALTTQTFAIPCRAVGSVKANGSVMQFEGGYLECDFPDLIATANDIIAQWGKEYMLTIGGDCKCAPIRLGYATVDAKPTAQGENPAFFHPDIAASMIRKKNDVRSAFRFAQETSDGALKPASQVSTLSSHYFCDEANGACYFEHFADGNQIKQEKRLFTPSYFNTGAVTVYIGYNPSTAQVFQGTMNHVDVDPGCRVN